MTNDEYRQLIAVLGERFDGIEAHLTRHDHEFVVLSRRLDALKADMDGQFREVRGQIEALAGHYQRLQQEYLYYRGPLTALHWLPMGDPGWLCLAGR